VTAVAPRTTRSLVVRLRLDRSQVPGLPSAAASDFGELTTVDGFVVATPTEPGPGHFPLRTAFVFVPKGLSSVSVARQISAAGLAGGLTVRNRGRHQGTADVFQWLVRDRRGDQRRAEVPDLVDVGFKSFPWDPATETETGADRQVVFAVALARGASTHSTHDVVVVVDVDGDRSEDYAIIGGDEGLELVGVPNGRFVTLTVDLNTFLVVDAYASEAPYHGSIVYLRTTASSLGTGPGSPSWAVWFSGGSPVLNRPVFDAAPNAGWLTMHPFRPVLSAGGATPTVVAPGAAAVVPVTLDATAPAQSVRGLLVVSPDDAAGPASADGVVVTGL
jgi:minor extracellular serine protease Vpr